MNQVVTCFNKLCENYNVPIELIDWDGSLVICGPCNNIIYEQAEWYVPPVIEDTGLVDEILNLSPEDLHSLIEVLNNVRR